MSGVPIQLGPLSGLDFPCPDPVATVVMTHGIGLGPWMFEPWVGTFNAWRLRVVALTMPGHTPGASSEVGAVTLVSAAEDVAQALGALSPAQGPGTVVLLGHSMSGLVAQLVATRPDMQALRGVVLLCPAPPGQVRVVPDLEQLKHLGSVAGLAAGRPARPSLDSYRALGMNKMSAEDAERAWNQSVPWPPGLGMGLLRRPRVDPTAVTMPVLVAIGFHDRVFPWQKARVLGDLYECVVWRYDDVGHMPSMESAGIRMARDIAAWCVQPTRPQVIESEGFGPAEGIGHLLRRARRGELMKKRSAYGQKKAAR